MNKLKSIGPNTEPWGTHFLLPSTPGIVRLLLLSGPVCSSSHSLQYFYTGISEPGQGLPQFIVVGYVDGQLFVQYDSNTKQMLPQVSWIKDNEDSNYWDRETGNMRGDEPVFSNNINIAKNRYNQTGGEWRLGVAKMPPPVLSPAWREHFLIFFLK
uniref:MHC class I-like antigen recognition-like domain-containing protein n=1 Tax=Salvator merianae TaxID=96440 RepID=A0A8D0B920_SALMN